MVSHQKINEVITHSVSWLKSQQNSDGSFGLWGPGSTSLVIMALISSAQTNLKPIINQAVSYLLNVKPCNNTYFSSFVILALVANGEKTQATLDRVQSDVDWLIQAQGNNPDKSFSFGGWGNSANPEMADGSNTQFALLALQAASTWKISIPKETWCNAITWYQRNYDINCDGSFVYRLDNNITLKNKDIIYTMTAAALSSMKIINLFSKDLEIKNQSETLFNHAQNWLTTNYMIKPNSDFLDSWYYYYLYSLANSFLTVLDTHDFLDDAANFLMALQKKDGFWISETDKESAKVIHTSFAILTLSKVIFFKQTTIPYIIPINGTHDQVDNSSNFKFQEIPYTKILDEETIRMGGYKIIFLIK